MKKLLNKFMISCEEATFLFSKSKEKKLTFAETMKLKFHLLMCKYCNMFSKQVDEIERELKKNVPENPEKLQFHLTDKQKIEIKKKIIEEKK